MSVELRVAEPPLPEDTPGLSGTQETEMHPYQGGLATGSVTGDLQGSLSNDLVDLMPAAAMALQSSPSSPTAKVPPPESGQASRSKGAPATLQQVPSSTDGDMMPVQLDISVLEGTQEENLQQQQQQQQPDVRMREEQEGAVTVAAMQAPQSAPSEDRPVRVVFSFAKQNAEQAGEMLKVTLHVGKFCYNRESLMEIRAQTPHDHMPTGWRAVQPEDEFVLKRSQLLDDERCWLGAKRSLVPPRDAGPGPQGHGRAWRGEQLQTHLTQPRQPWSSMNGPQGGPLPPPQTAQAPRVHDGDPWLSTHKRPASPGALTPGGDAPMNGQRGRLVSGRPLQQPSGREIIGRPGQPPPALGQLPGPQPRPPSEDLSNGEFVMPKRPQPSLFVDEDGRWPAAQWEQDEMPQQPHEAPAGRPHPKLHLLQSSGGNDPGEWSIPAVNEPPMHDVSEDVLESLRHAGIRLTDDCMFLLGGLPLDTQEACVLPLIQAANRTGRQDGSMFIGVILGVAAVQGAKAEQTASKAADSAGTVAPRTHYPLPGFEHIQAAAAGSAADTPTSSDDAPDTFTQFSRSKATRPPPGFEKWQQVPAPSAVVSLQSANGFREDHVNARGRSTSRPASRASSGELDPDILAMLLPKAPEQEAGTHKFKGRAAALNAYFGSDEIESYPFGGVLKRASTEETAEDARNNREFWGRPSGTSDRDLLLDDMRSNNHHEGIRLETSSAASDSYSEGNLFSREFGILKEGLKSDRYPPHMRKPDRKPEHIDSRTGRDPRGLQNGSAGNRPVPSASDQEQEDQSLYERLEKALSVPSESSAQQTRMSVFNRLSVPQTSQSVPSEPMDQQTRASVFDRLTFPQISEPQTPAQQKQLPAPQSMMRPPVLQDNDSMLRTFDTPLSKISEASERSECPSTGAKKSDEEVDQWVVVGQSQSSSSPGFSSGFRSEATTNSAAVHSDVDSNEPGAQQESASVSATAVAILDLVLPEGRKYNPLAAQQWSGLSHTIKLALTSATDERIIDAVHGYCAEEAVDLTKSLVVLLEPVHRAYHPETAACWRVLTSQERLQVRDGVLNGRRLHLGMLEPRRRVLARRMATEHPSVAPARAHMAGMCPQLRDMLLLLLDRTDCLEVLDAVVAALTGMEKLEDEEEVDSMQSSKTVSAAPARHAQVQNNLHGYSQPPQMVPKSQTSAPTASAAPTTGPGVSNCAQYPDWLQILCQQNQSLDSGRTSQINSSRTPASDTANALSKQTGSEAGASSTPPPKPSYATVVGVLEPAAFLGRGANLDVTFKPVARKESRIETATARRADLDSTRKPAPASKDAICQLPAQPCAKPMPNVPPLSWAAPGRPQPKSVGAASLFAPPVISRRVMDDGKRKREAAPAAPATSATKPGKKKPWWETEQGAEELASVQEVYGGRRNADNTMTVLREIDEFEELGLLEPSVFQGETKKKKRSNAPAPTQQYAAARQAQRFVGGPAAIPQSAQRAPQPQAGRPSPPTATAVPPMPIGPPPGLAPPPPGFASVLAKLSRV
ncbi:hypothetical protein COCOBI_09-0540 [Coccomyxa sp. Obi]|nr:hypothetical protein COCOBI_09-0540 [Coccomyxa sp. Obi]